MAVAIRLRREGALNRPYFKVVVADKRSPRVEYWISKGAQPSDTVRSLIKKNKNPEAVAKKAEATAAKKAAKASKPAVAKEPAPAAAPAAPETPSESTPAAPETPKAEVGSEEKSAR